MSRNLLHSRAAWMTLAGAVLGAAILHAALGFFEKATSPRADLVLGNGTEPESLDPAAASGTPEARVARALFEPLVILHPKTLTIMPGVAQRWESSADGRTYTFHLQPSGAWSDGTPLRAGDVAWSLLRVLRPETGARYASNLFDVRGARAFARPAKGVPRPAEDSVGIQAVDPLTLRIELEHPSPSFLQILSMPAFSPVPRHVVERAGATWTKAGTIVGNGPFRLVERRLRERLRLERNPHYWNANSVGLRTMDILVSDSLGTLLNMFFTGDADWVTDVPASLVSTLKRDHPGEFRASPLLGTYFFRINTRHAVLGNRNIREALDLALDKETLVRAIHHGGEVPAWTLVPATLPQWTPPDVLRFDPSRAKDLLQAGLRELGLIEMPSFELLYNTSELHQSVAELVQIQWRDTLGVTCRLARQEWSAARAAIRKLDYSVARGVWLADYEDPLSFLEIFTTTAGNNQTGFSDPRFDAIVDELARTTADPGARRARLREAEAILMRAHAIVPLYHYVSYNLVRAEIGGFEDNLLDVHFPQFFTRSAGRPR